MRKLKTRKPMASAGGSPLRNDVLILCVPFPALLPRFSPTLCALCFLAVSPFPVWANSERPDASGSSSSSSKGQETTTTSCTQRVRRGVNGWHPSSARTRAFRLPLRPPCRPLSLRPHSKSDEQSVLTLQHNMSRSRTTTQHKRIAVASRDQRSAVCLCCPPRFIGKSTARISPAPACVALRGDALDATCTSCVRTDWSTISSW
jgi:hypothetical protein